MMKPIGCVLILAAVTGLVGCNSSSDTTADKAANAGSEHSHDHGVGTQDHSVQGHGHGVGPHEGTIADWGGGKFHVEFTVDHDRQEATVYILGSDEKTAIPIDAATIELAITDPEIQVTLQALPQDGEPEGKSSRFVGTHEKLGVVQEYTGTMTGVVDGTPYSGDFIEEAHGNHHH